MTNDSFFPATHIYPSNGTYTVTVTAFSTGGETRTNSNTVAVSTLQPACADTFRVYPPIVYLKQGKTNEVLRIDIRRPDGRSVAIAPGAASFVSSAPTLVPVTVQGLVSCTGLTQAHIQVTVQGHPRKATVPVYAGEILLEPSILVLSTNPPTPGQVSLRAFNATGAEESVSGRQVVFIGGNTVATVSTQGMVNPLRPPAQFSDTPYISATLDGMFAGNGCVVRVTSQPLNLNMQDHSGSFVTFRVADQFGSYAYGSLLEQLQVVQVSDTVFRLAHRLCGLRPNRGSRQFLVMEPGIDEDGTVPCGLSGNPIRLGAVVNNLRSCLGGTDWIHWGIIAHELGHNFLSHASFMDFFSGLADPSIYVEGFATALGAYCYDEILSAPERYGINSATVATMRGNLYLMPDSIRSQHYSALTNYEAAPNYANFNADLLDAIMLKLGDEYGAGFMFRFMSVFYPLDVPFMNYRDETERLTFWVGACSAAAGTDLRSRFRDKWGYPISDAFYEEIFPLLRQRARQRDPLLLSSSIEAGSVQLISSTVLDTTYYLQRSQVLGEWTSIQTNTASGYIWETSDPFQLSAPMRFYRLLQSR